MDHEPSTVPIPQYTNSQQPTTTVLLPNQMYPENSLMRTHSLGNIQNDNQQHTEKGFTDLDQEFDNRTLTEKKWMETSLDSQSGPVLTHIVPSLIKINTSPLIPQQENNTQLLYEPLVNNFDTVIIIFCLHLNYVTH